VAYTTRSGTPNIWNMSVKRKPGKKLTPAEKEYNKALAKIQIRVEHAIRRVKVFRVIGDRYRNPRKNIRS